MTASTSTGTGRRLPRIDVQLFIGGKWIEAEKGERFDVTDPGTMETVGSAPMGRRPDAVKALEAAQQAFASWSRKSAYERGPILRRAAELIRNREQEIGTTLTREQGKPLIDSLKEIRFAADVFEYYAEEAKRVRGEWITTVSTSTRSIIMRQPIGVVAAIVPWNFPVDLLSWKIGPALAAGCTVAVKPPRETPLAVAQVIKCFEDAGLPAGALNMVSGAGSEVGEELITHPISRKISITGSTATGRRVMELAAPA